MKKVDRLRYSDPAEFEAAARQLARWAIDYKAAIAAARPAMPDSVNDRQADNWEGLFSIAAIAGGAWPRKALEAALVLCAAAKDDTGSQAETLLSNIRDIMASPKFAGEMSISSQDLVSELVNMVDRPWAECNRGKNLSPNGLARKLKPFGIRPGHVGQAANRINGYRLADFDDVFARYLVSSQNPGSQPHRPHSLHDINDLAKKSILTSKECQNPSSHPVVSDIAGFSMGCEDREVEKPDSEHANKFMKQTVPREADIKARSDGREAEIKAKDAESEKRLGHEYRAARDKAEHASRNARSQGEASSQPGAAGRSTVPPKPGSPPRPMASPEPAGTGRPAKPAEPGRPSQVRPSQGAPPRPANIDYDKWAPIDFAEDFSL